MKTLVIMVAVLAVFWVATQWRAVTREAAWEALYPPEGQFVTVDGVQVHLMIEGEGPDVVLIHGSSGNLRDMTFALSKSLSDRYRVISVDRPGLGYTDGFDPSGEPIMDQASVLSRAVAKVGAEKPIVLGQSYGGAVALAWATSRPDSLAGLVLVSSPAFAWDGGLPTFYKITSSWLGNRLAVPLMTAYVPQSYIDGSIDAAFAPNAVPDGYAAHLGGELAGRRGMLRANAMQRANLKEEVRAMQGLYGSLTLPIELVHAPDDEVVPIDIHALPFVEVVPTATLTQTPGVGHMPHHLALSAVGAAVDRAATAAGLSRE